MPGAANLTAEDWHQFHCSLRCWCLLGPSALRLLFKRVLRVLHQI